MWVARVDTMRAFGALTSTANKDAEDTVWSGGLTAPSLFVLVVLGLPAVLAHVRRQWRVYMRHRLPMHDQYALLDSVATTDDEIDGTRGGVPAGQTRRVRVPTSYPLEVAGVAPHPNEEASDSNAAVPHSPRSVPAEPHPDHAEPEPQDYPVTLSDAALQQIRQRQAEARERERWRGPLLPVLLGAQVLYVAGVVACKAVLDYLYIHPRGVLVLHIVVGALVASVSVVVMIEHKLRRVSALILHDVHPMEPMRRGMLELMFWLAVLLFVADAVTLTSRCACGRMFMVPGTAACNAETCLGTLSAVLSTTTVGAQWLLYVLPASRKEWTDIAYCCIDMLGSLSGRFSLSSRRAFSSGAA